MTPDVRRLLADCSRDQLAAAAAILERAGTEDRVDARTLGVEAELAAPVAAVLRLELEDGRSA